LQQTQFSKEPLAFDSFHKQQRERVDQAFTSVPVNPTCATATPCLRVAASSCLLSSAVVAVVHERGDGNCLVLIYNVITARGRSHRAKPKRSYKKSDAVSEVTTELAVASTAAKEDVLAHLLQPTEKMMHWCIAPPPPAAESICGLEWSIQIEEVRVPAGALEESGEEHQQPGLWSNRARRRRKTSSPNSHRGRLEYVIYSEYREGSGFQVCSQRYPITRNLITEVNQTNTN
jgi:hypothetical protein